MKATIDSAGRIVIPKSVRESANLAPGTELQIRVRDSVIELEPVSTEVHLRREGEFLVAEPVKPKERLTSQVVSETIRSLRSSR